MNVDWIRLAQKSDQYLVLVNMSMNFVVPYKACNSLTSQFKKSVSLSCSYSGDRFFKTRVITLSLIYLIFVHLVISYFF
jgi:hypothetical protein